MTQIGLLMKYREGMGMKVVTKKGGKENECGVVLYSFVPEKRNNRTFP